MIKWFNDWFVRKCVWAWENRQDSMTAKHMNSIGIGTVEEINSWGDGLRINIKKMIGGYVVSFRVYDKVRDRNDDRHYIITDEHDFERELSKMITIESMRQA